MQNGQAELKSKKANIKPCLAYYRIRRQLRWFLQLQYWNCVYLLCGYAILQIHQLHLSMWLMHSVYCFNLIGHHKLLILFLRKSSASAQLKVYAIDIDNISLGRRLIKKH